MHKGFTLIEMMIVVAIISIVSAIAVPAYNGYIQVAKIKECRDEITIIEIAQDTYYNLYLTYFSGADVEAIVTASKGEYIPTSRFKNKTANCTIKIDPSPDGIKTGYKITATGANDLKDTGTEIVKQNY